MREKLLSLPLTQLREIAKSKGIPRVTAIRKSQLVELILEKVEAEAAQTRAPGVEESPEQPSAEPVLPEAPRRDEQTVREPGRNYTARVFRTANTRGASQVRTGGAYSTQDRNRREGERREYTPRDTERREAAPRDVERRDVLRERQPEPSPRRMNAQPSEGECVPPESSYAPSEDLSSLDSGIRANGILEVMPEGFGFIRCDNYMPGDNDVYVAPTQIRRFNLKTGDIIEGSQRIRNSGEKFPALLYISSINGYPPYVAERRPSFEDLTPVFPYERLHLELPGCPVANRIVDLISPIGKGQRGMIVSPPKAGKTTLLKQVAKAVTQNHPDVHLIVLLIDERPEEVTDMKESIGGPEVEVIYSTFDESPEHHKRVAEMVLGRAKRLVEHGRDVMILLDSITRLTRAYNQVVVPSGRTLSGGLDPAALYAPKRFFGAARKMREGGSLTVLATALVETGSRMDDVVFEEFKGTGNMELVLNRKLSERRIFPAVDILKSGTRRDDLLLDPDEFATMEIIRRVTSGMKAEDAAEKLMDIFAHTRSNREVEVMVRKVFKDFDRSQAKKE